MLSSMCSSYGFVYLLEPTFSVKQPRHKQLFSNMVHLNQRGLVILNCHTQSKHASNDLVEIM